MAEAWTFVTPLLGQAIGTAIGIVTTAWIAIWCLGKDGLLEFWKGKLKLVNEKDLETFKATLQRENDRLRSDLSIVASTITSQRSSLNEKIAEVVAGTYSRLVKVRWAVAAYVAIL